MSPNTPKAAIPITLPRPSSPAQGRTNDVSLAAVTTSRPLEGRPGRLLLLLPTKGYRAQAFIEAADRVGVDLTIASEEPSSLEALNPGGLLALNFGRPLEAAASAAAFARQYPVAAVVGVDDATSLLQSVLCETLGLPSSPAAAVSAAREKFQMRRLLDAAGLPGPAYRLLSIDDDPTAASWSIQYPCVLKPLVLSGSRGVIRADDESMFVSAFRRIAALLQEPDTAALGEGARQILVEGYLPGREVALEGLLMDGNLQVLALFDKPDPLTGPYFEETLYVTPSRLYETTQQAVARAVAAAAAALGLRTGPIHAELRVENERPIILEVNPRSIGGKCSRMLRFGSGMTLEELILRQALGVDIPSLQREAQSVGTMMIPIPGAGILADWKGEDRALAVPGITGLEMTAHRGQVLVPLPEGSAYLGFLFAAGATPADVETSLRSAHHELRFVIR